MTWAVTMLCAGLGTRLRPLTTLVPKPLVPVGDKPLVEHAIAVLYAAGARDVALNAFYLPEQVSRFVDVLRNEGARRFDGATFECVVEHELLGTGGGVRGAYRGHEHVVVWNGDIYAPELAIVEMLSFGRQEWPVLVVAPTTGTAGTVGLGSDGRVVRLRGETFGAETHAADYVGVGVFPRAFIEALPPRGCLVGDGLLPWLARGKPVATITHAGYWSDGGTLAQYLAQNRHWLTHHRESTEGASGRDDHATPGGEVAVTSSYVGANARRSSGVTLVESVVGDDAHVLGSGELLRCVVWPTAVAAAPLADAVVLPGGRIVNAHGVLQVKGNK